MMPNYINSITILNVHGVNYRRVILGIAKREAKNRLFRTLIKFGVKSELIF